MLKTFGEDHFSVAQYGIIAITNLTSNADIRNSLGGLNACQLIVQMLRLHAFKVKEWENVLIFVVVCFFAFFCVMGAGQSLTPSCFAMSALQKLEHHDIYILVGILFPICLLFFTQAGGGASGCVRSVCYWQALFEPRPQQAALWCQRGVRTGVDFFLC